MLTDQWFVDTAKIVEPALEAVRSGRTKIMPPSGEKTYFNWLENIEPWCISRQIWWGHQVPVWYGPTLEFLSLQDLDEYASKGQRTGAMEFFCAPTASEALAKAKVFYGERFKEIRLVESQGALFAIKGDVLEIGRDPDVLDTWFSSGLWPIGTLGWPEDTPELKKYFPTSVLVTGFDIIFFWVARMMMMQLAVVGDIPFHTVYLHGLVRDAKGKKMSKSLGNVIDPLDIIDEYGADALRFANCAMASLGGVLKADTQRIAGYRNFGTKLWNATRFAEMNAALCRDIVGTDAGRMPDARHTVNRWIIGEVARARIAVDEALEAFRFNDAANTLYAFVWGKVCDWYVEFAKPLMDGDFANETRQTMAWVLDQCYILLHPIMPFITEELWALTGERQKMLVHADWPTYGAEIIDETADAEINWVIRLIEEIRSARTQMRVPVGLKLPMILTALDDKGRDALARNRAIIDRLARIDGLTEGAAPKGAITIPVEGGSFALPLEGVIDLAAEKSRLSKSLEKLEKDMGGLRGRLDNPKFVASAPEEVIAETRDNLALNEDEAMKLKAALARLAEAV
ncbi:MAG: class I tRNA ligase family protein [Paracoccaceae bacterium]